MWDCCFCSSLNQPSNNKKPQPLSIPFLNHHKNHLAIQIQEEYDYHDDDGDGDGDAVTADAQSNPPLSAFAMIFTSWLRTSTTRYLILALCSPLLLPLFAATFPCLCVLEVFFRLCRRRRRRTAKKRRRRRSMDGCDGDSVHQNEDGANGEKLLHRYLEDQLILVAGSLHEYGIDDDDNVVDVEYFDNRNPALQLGES